MFHKFLLFCSLIILCLIGWLFFQKSENISLYERPCAFCNEYVLSAQKFYENDLAIALVTHKPVMQGHMLIIPKRHVERFELLSDDEMSALGRLIKRVHASASQVYQTSSYLLLQKNGTEMGQTIPHVHFHYIPRKDGENSVLLFMLKMYIANLLPPLSAIEMKAEVDKMKAAAMEQATF